ncbi:hypothetical protein JCM33374_g6297 [Metschnikowia sp. JCM 33374]|nr:hypothetical protein JCM33374_g6297 [Metschnikowia sp. JCM 33374]
MKSLVWTTLFTAIAAVNTGRGINQEHTSKVYIDTHPVVSGPHKFSTGEVRRAMFHVGRPNSDVFNSGDKDTPNHDAFASSPMTKVLESGVVYSVTVVYIAGTENVPAYVKSPDGVKHKLEGKMKQVSTSPGTSDEGSSSESPADSESEALPSTPHTDSEFKYSVYLIPHRAAAEKAIQEFSEFSSSSRRRSYQIWCQGQAPFHQTLSPYGSHGALYASCGWHL